MAPAVLFAVLAIATRSCDAGGDGGIGGDGGTAGDKGRRRRTGPTMFCGCLPAHAIIKPKPPKPPPRPPWRTKTHTHTSLVRLLHSCDTMSAAGLDSRSERRRFAAYITKLQEQWHMIWLKH